MKSVNFKRKESVLRSVELNEQKLTHRKINWDRVVYLSLLALALFFGIRYFVNKYLYIEGNGQVLFDSVDIRNTTDCRIIDFFIEEGDEVRKGDRLFSFAPADDNGNFGDSNGDFSLKTEKISKADVSWAEREIFGAEQKIKVLGIQIKGKQTQLEILKKEIDRLQNGVALDAIPSYRLDDQYTLIYKLETEIGNLQGERGVIQGNIAQLRGMIRQLGTSTKTDIASDGDGSGGNGLDIYGNRIFFSPLAGTVTNKMKKEFEVALKSESILAVHKPENVYIKAFFKQEDLKHLDEGQKVTLTFPDGTESIGIIKRFYFSTFRLPEEFQKKYEPTTRSLSADIYPMDHNDLKQWKAYWKMAVRITKYKYDA
jgi:multidrug resistance efflux pump